MLIYLALAMVPEMFTGGNETGGPPQRRPGSPEAGVGTLAEKPDAAHAFGPAVPPVAGGGGS